MSKSKRSKKPTEAVSGSYAALPHKVLDSVALRGASLTAKALLLHAIVRQLNGRNNGRLHLTTPWLHEHGWRSRDVVVRARDELIERKLIVMTRQGGSDGMPHQFAVTWLPISSFQDLEVKANTYQQNAYLLFAETPGVVKPRSRKVPKKREEPADNDKTPAVRRTGANPSHGLVIAISPPSDGRVKGVKDKKPNPSDSDNVLRHSLPQRAAGLH